MKTLQITNVKTIFGIDKPIVVFEVAGHDAIVRNPKQALVDLQNSGRCLELSANALSKGVEGLNPLQRQQFTKALLRCRNAQLIGDITPVKAGDKYTITEFSSAYTNKDHKLYGKVNIGDVVTIDEDSSPRVEGFLSIPETGMEIQIEANANAMAGMMLSMFGFAPAANVAQLSTTSQPFIDEQNEESLKSELAFHEGVGGDAARVANGDPKRTKK